MPEGERLSRDELLHRLVGLIEGIDVAHPTRVAIDGVDAVGKTTLADELAIALSAAGNEAIRASVDGFHRPRSKRYERGPDSPAGYYLDSFDYRALRSLLLEPLGPGGSRSYRPAAFDLDTDTPLDLEPRTAGERAVLVFDGVFLLRPELRDVWDVRILVRAGIDETVRRAVKRDAVRFGSADEVERRYRVRYIPGQSLYFEQARPDLTADAVVLNDHPTAPRLRLRSSGDDLSPRFTT